METIIYGMPDRNSMKCCDMRGFLSFLILWILKKGPMNGAEISRELEKRKGNKPSPGTLYPALKELREKRLISADERKVYSLTAAGEKALSSACRAFSTIFYDAKDISSCCCVKK